MHRDVLGGYKVRMGTDIRQALVKVGRGEGGEGGRGQRELHPLERHKNTIRELRPPLYSGGSYYHLW